MKSVYRIVTVVTVGGLLLLAAAAYALGIAGYERYSGYFAPIWDDEAKGVFIIQRDTSGFIWGAGWEGFSPPAHSYPLSDTFSLRYLDADNGRVDVLQSWPGSPLAGRATSHYRGKIFNFVSVRLEPVDGAIEFVIKLQIPHVPKSENWTLAGTWRRGEPANAEWSQKWSSPSGISDATLKAGMEVIRVKGRESFPAAIVAVHADGSHRVLIKNDDFDRLYPDGIPAQRSLKGHGVPRSNAFAN